MLITRMVRCDAKESEDLLRLPNRKQCTQLVLVVALLLPAAFGQANNSYQTTAGEFKRPVYVPLDRSEEDWSFLKDPELRTDPWAHSSTLLCVTLQVGTLRWLEKNAPSMNSIAITTGVPARKTAMDTISIVFLAALIFTWAPQHASSSS
jgi:hypothetical protein